MTKVPAALVAAATLLGAACVSPPPREAAPLPTATLTPLRPTIVASVAEDIAEVPEVYALTDTGDVLPAAATEIGAQPEPEGATGAFYTRLSPPVLDGPRRVGIQAGHWLTEEVPPELWRLRDQTGSAAAGVQEVDINRDVAERTRAILEARGVAVDVLPATIPPGYVADAFVALHADGDAAGAARGFKIAHSARRTPYENDLVALLRENYAAATDLPYDDDPEHRTLNMTSYYAFTWQRVVHATSPFTPSAIVEMGYVTNGADRELLTGSADLVAAGIAEAILRFLDTHPRSDLFGHDLLLPVRPQFSITP